MTVRRRNRYCFRAPRGDGDGGAPPAAQRSGPCLISAAPPSSRARIPARTAADRELLVQITRISLVERVARQQLVRQYAAADPTPQKECRPSRW